MVNIVERDREALTYISARWLVSLKKQIPGQTYVEIKAPAHRLHAALDKVGCALRDAVKRLRADNVGVGVAVREDAFPPSMLRVFLSASEV